MTDIADRAQQGIDTYSKFATQASAFAGRELLPCGRCHNCSEYLENPMKLFCDDVDEAGVNECQADWDLRQRATKQLPLDKRGV